MDFLLAYKFPSKVNKFKITKPSLMIFIAKYENQIPWASGINSEITLEKCISTMLLPELYRASELPVLKQANKSYFVESRHVNLGAYTENYAAYQRLEIDQFKELLQQGGTAAKVCVADMINMRKSKAFHSWKSLMKKEYKHDPAFIYMLLRSIFDTTPYGSRRELATPDKNIIQWMYLNISRKAFDPQESLAKNYFLKKSFGVNSKIENGWQFIPMGSKNNSKLSAAAKGSGWCIEDRYMSTYYLEDHSFYILRKSGKPVVALRVNSREIHECVGIHNSIPSAYSYDIKLYTDYMKLTFVDLFDQSHLSGLSYDNFSSDWWEQRVTLWPGSYFKMDAHLKGKFEKPVLENFIQYLEYIPLEKLKSDFELDLNFEELVKALTISPQLFERINTLIESEPNKEVIKLACIAGWLVKIENGELTLWEHKNLPLFVKESEGYHQLLEKQISTQLYKELYKVPKTFFSRSNRLNVEDLLVYSEFESYEVTLKRTTSIILNIESSDFSDYIFPDYLQNRSDFQKLRTDAWKEAIAERPSFRLALPHDLSILPEFGFDDSMVDSLKLQKAVDTISKKPWYLDSKSKIPKNIRHREVALKAYIKGWQHIISKNPNRLWCVTNRTHGRREYISFAALRNKQIIDTFFIAYREAINKNSDIWVKLSERTQNIPVMKFVFLIALHNSVNEKLKKKYFSPNSPLKESMAIDETSALNMKIIHYGGAHFCFQDFKNNRLGNGMEFSDFSS